MRPNVLTVTLTTTELSALVAGARMALDALRARPDTVPEAAITILARAVEDYDRARTRLDSDGGGPAGVVATGSTTEPQSETPA